MCGIIGVFDKDAVPQVEKGLLMMKNRGLDSFGHFDGKNLMFNQSSSSPAAGCIGHRLHSIVNFVPQPIKKKGVIVANNEVYNWRDLKEKYGLLSRNDSELILDLFDKRGINKIKETIDEFDGVYAFAYWFKDEIVIARDILGVKPVFYSKKPFAFSSEKKVLLELGYREIEELNPRKILIYDIKSKKLRFLQRQFFCLSKKYIPKEQLGRLKGLLINAVSKRIPNSKFGILFSGGVDSTLIALICKQLDVPFTCYVAALVGESVDVNYAERVAEEYNFELKVVRINQNQVEDYLKKVVPMIEDSNVIKVGVALTGYVACEHAKKDGIKVIYSGLGSDELFAGYERFRHAININKECLSRLIKIYEGDLYRDDVISMNNNLELRLPYLDKDLVKFALNINPTLKLNEDHNKIILRKIAEELGLRPEFAQRKKKAAQYGSNFDKAIGKNAKLKKFTKSAYLDTFLKKPIMNLGILFSGGKDSCLAMHIMKQQNYNISCLITIKSQNKDSYMFHTPAIDLTELQAVALGLPLVEVGTLGEKEKELLDLEKALILAKKQYGLNGVVTGALFSNYQRERIEKIADKIGLKIFSPLWHKDQELEMRDLLNQGFEIIFTGIAADGLDKSWLNRKITEKDVDRLVALNKKLGLNVAGEGGEFESLVLDSPMFKKKIVIDDNKMEISTENAARLIILKTHLVNK